MIRVCGQAADSAAAHPMTTTPPATEHLLQLQQVSFAYSSGQRLILDRLSLNVPRGKVTALMGASGGGKTTVLRLIGGQQRPGAL